MDPLPTPSAIPAISTRPPAPIARSLFFFALLYGGLVVLAGVLGTKLASLGTWPGLGQLAVECGIFAFLILVVLASATAELHGKDTANRLVRVGFIPLIVSMLLLSFVIHAVPPAPFWPDQDIFAKLLGQGARMQFAGLISYGVSQTLNVWIFARLSGSGAGTGHLLLVRGWVAGMLSQAVDTVLFITISFAGQGLPLLRLMEGQIISKLALSTIMVPPLIWLFVRLGRKLDA